MARCKNPDEKLYQSDCVGALGKYVATLQELHQNNRKWFYNGICGALWYHTPVVWANHIDTRTKWRYGIELEVELHRFGENGEEFDHIPNFTAMVAWDVLTKQVKPHQGGVTLDESLDRGWEAVIAPFSPQRAANIAAAIYNHPFIRPFLRHFGNAALHVTVDPFETWEDQRAFHDFWNDPRFFDDFLCVTHRFGNSYCRPRQVTTVGFMKPDQLTHHYNRCNVRENGAMEVRVFQAVYMYEVTLQQIRLVDIVNRAVRRGVRRYEDLRKLVCKRLPLED